MPFGEEIYADTANRTTNGKYSPYGTDGVRKRFTGYEKDAETGLDFAEARMYENRHGRFTAVDPLLASGLSANPQTFNRYVYALNEPIRNTDSSGMWTDKEWSSIRPGVFSPDLSDLLDKLGLLQEAQRLWNDQERFPNKDLVWRDDYYTSRNGSIDVYLTEDEYDRFFVERKDVPGQFDLVATLTKNSAGLVEFPSSGSGFSRYGSVDAGGGDHGPGDHYVQPVVAAALFGLVAVLGDDFGFTISLGDMSSSNGRDPWEPGFKHHTGHGHNKRSGLDVNFRYLDSYGQSFRSETTATIDPRFSVANNQLVYDTAKRFGFTSNYQGTRTGLTGVSRVAGHNDHGHLGFNTGSNVRIHKVVKVLPNGTKVYN